MERERAAPTDISLVVVDAHPLYRRGIVAAIASAPDITLVGTASNAPDAIDLIAGRRPRVAVVDIALAGEDGRDIVRAVRARSLPTRVLLLAERQLGDTVLQSVTVGAAGSVSRAISEPGFVAAIRQVDAAQKASSGDIGPAPAAPSRQHGVSLTARERQILAAISVGESTAAIAARLHLSMATVESHIQNLYGKLGAHDRASAVATAIRRSIIH